MYRPRFFVAVAIMLLAVGCGSPSSPQDGPSKDILAPEAIAQTLAAPPPATVAPIVTPTPRAIISLTPRQVEAPSAAPTRLPLPSATEGGSPSATSMALETAVLAPSLTPSPTPRATLTRRARRLDGPSSNIGPYLLMNPESGQPTHDLLSEGAMRGYMAINPEHWTPHDQLPHMEGYGRNWIPEEEELGYLGRGELGARAYYEKYVTSYEHTRGDIHAWMSTWAYRYGDEAFAAAWVEFQVEWLRLMHEAGYLAGVGGMRTHLFGEGEILTLAPAIAQADYLFLSEAGAPTLRSSMDQTNLLYRQLMVELSQSLGPEQIPPLILDVCVDGRVLAELSAPGGPWWQRGYRDFDTPQAQYVADIRAYDLETLQDPEVRHVFWFATNVMPQTGSFDVNTEMLAQAESWHRVGYGR